MRDWKVARHLLLLLCGVTVPLPAEGQQPQIEFDRDIRPILSDLCFQCHGPDEGQRLSGLRLDRRDGMFAMREGLSVVTPGDPAKSLLYQRITAEDPEIRMPPAESGRSLSVRQTELLELWIRQGAEWSEHWAFVPLAQTPPPVPKHSEWSRNPIDDFVLSRLESEGLRPSPEADRPTLIRRVTLDLTGLPPTLDEVDAFLADHSEDAWDTVVNRLLGSTAFGEHMAVAWLDAARYADTSGYQNDGPRSMWRWRDWVIDAFNRNLPFDQFTVEQIAGDLLENPSLDQLIATGFNRNHRGNAEGGIIPEEYQVEYVVDRVDTTFAVWLGLTMGCARCHDHKYDPIRQKEYYQVFAYFNNVPENGRAIKEGNSPPYIRAPLPEQAALLHELDHGIEAAERRVTQLQPLLLSAIEAWEPAVRPHSEPDWSVTEGLVCHFSFEGNLQNSVNAVEAVSEPVGTTFSRRLSEQAAELTGESQVNAGDTANFGYFDRFTIAFWVRPDGRDGTLISRMTPVEQGDGYWVHLRDGHIQVNLVKRWLDDAIRVESPQTLPAGEWSHLTIVYDGSRLAAGIHVYLNGERIPLDVRLDRLNQTFATKLEPLRIGGGQSRFRGDIDDVRIFSRDLSPEEAQLLAEPQTVSGILQIPRNMRTAPQRQKLMRSFLERHADVEVREAFQTLKTLRRQRRDLDDRIPTVMVMQEMESPRQTHLLVRGQYDRPGEAVQPGVPEAFAPVIVNRNHNRLDLAQWLVSPENPLTARVAVNRFWQRHFEHGLVRTSEDFGSQGEPPSHPELLDWLAAEFIRSGWNIKSLLRLIVSSSTYRQASIVSPELLGHDPDNRLLARGPRRRLPAETVRDQALFVSGLLSRKVGGPSVRPYQPEGLWQEIATDTDYVQSHGEDLYRRSLYTYWKRTVAPPTMVTLDAVSREACTVKRSVTNTPLQALALMNDVTFVEAARVLAQKALARSEVSLDNRILQLFRTVTMRNPTEKELIILRRRFEKNLEAYRAHPDEACWLVSTGEYPVDQQLDSAELAALTTVASMILNLDEVISKE